MKRPVLSVIIPYYNGEEFIEHTIQSVLISSLKDLEILLIDDGSSGNSGNICDILASRYNNIRTIHKLNGGIADARNRGIREASGKYLAFVDQDDTVDSNMYLSLIRTLEQYNCDIISSNFYVTDIKTGKREIASIIKKDELLHEKKIKDLRKRLVMGEVMPPSELNIPPNIWNCVISSDLVKKNDICFESFIRYDDDWVFLLRCLAFSKSVLLCKDAYYNWLVHGTSESHTAKYLPAIVEKYKKLKEFKIDYIINWCNVEDAELESFTAYFDINTVYETICNESVSNNIFAESRQIIQDVIKRNELKKMTKKTAQQAIKALTIKKGKKAGVIYSLAMHRLYFFALLLCRIKR